VGPSRALAVLAALASPTFLAASVAAWLAGLWPANPLTLGIAALLVVGGPVLGIVHVLSASRPPAEPASPPAPAPRPHPTRRRTYVTQPAYPVPERLAAARAFHAWRGRPSARRRA
jgi:hypothetical protein